MSERQHLSADGEPVSLARMVRDEPEWAASRIRRGESAEQALEQTRAADEALFEAVTRRMEQLDAAGRDTHFASERDIYTACRSDLAEVAESLRLMLTDGDHG